MKKAIPRPTIIPPQPPILDPSEASGDRGVIRSAVYVSYCYPLPQGPFQFGGTLVHGLDSLSSHKRLAAALNVIQNQIGRVDGVTILAWWPVNQDIAL